MIFLYFVLFSIIKLNEGFEFNPPAIQELIVPKNLAEDTTARLFCSLLKGTQPVLYEWFLNGKKIDENEYFKIRNDEDLTQLTIKSLSFDLMGEYECIVSNSYGKDSKKTQVKALFKPKWIVEPQNLTASQFNQIDIVCNASGFPIPEITWFKLSEGNTQKEVASKRLNFVLEKGNSGFYECKAENSLGIIKKAIYLGYYVPAKFNEKFSVKTVKKGESAKLFCSAEGDQPLTISWYKDSQLLNKSKIPGIEIYESQTADGVSSELFIASADRNDGAHYNCKAENAYGKDEKTNKLQVIESPGSPSQVSIRERWSRSVSISWQSPYTGNAQLTGYIIQYWRETPTGLNKRLHEVNVSASLSFYLLKDLLPGTSYELSILAENEVGRGNSSQVVRFTTGEEEPEASPLDVLVESRWPTTIRISWKPPPEETHNGKILGYYIGYKLSSSNHQGSFSYKTVPVLHNSYEYFLTSLHKGTEYIVIVKAYNSAGSGPSSQEMLVKTLSGDLPLAPRLHILTTTINSVHLLWRPSTETSISGNNANTKVLGYSLYYKIDEHNSNWREISVPANENKVEQEYILEDLQVNTFYRVYITATNSYGQGDPSNMVTIKTNKDEKSSVLQTSIFPSTNQVSMSSDLDIISVITITIAVVIVVFVIVVACVCVKKAQLEALRTPIDLSAVTLPRNMTDAEKSVYIGNTHRYVDFDKSKPLMQGNYSFDTGFPVPYSTMPLKDSQMSEEMKSYVAHQKPWDRPLPPTAATNKRKSGLEIQQHVYDCPQ